MQRSIHSWRFLFVGGLLATMLSASGCKNDGEIKDLFVAGGPGDVDMLWVIDNSASMADAQVQLSLNFISFVEALPATSTTQMGITTTQAWPCTEDEALVLCDDRKGSTGRLRRYGNSPTLLDPSHPADQAEFQEMAHVGVQGAGLERPLQVALMAACEAVELPNSSDFDPASDSLEEDFPWGCSGNDFPTDNPYYEACHCLPLTVDLQYEDMEEPGEMYIEEGVGLHSANQGLLRDNPFHVVILTDEGDGTSTVDSIGGGACDDLDSTELCDCRLDSYLELLRQVTPDVRISVLGPGQGPNASDEDMYKCNPMGSSACSVDFFFNSVTRTDGLFFPLLDPVEGQDECDEAELATALANLVLFHPSMEWFQLSLVPDINTFVITRNSEAVPAYEDGSSCDENSLTSGGWVYDEANITLTLVGDCTAYPGDLVEVAYTSTGPLMII